jgi:hypothetical protein
MRGRFAVSILIAVVASGAGMAPADDVDFVDLARSAPSADEFPGADGLYLLLDRDVQIDETGREVMTLRQAVRIFTNQGRLEFSDYRFPYDEAAQAVEVRTARTVRSDLRTVDVDEDAINDITPPELEGAAVYSNALEKVFSYPAALKGSTLALELRRESVANENGLFGGSAEFQLAHPVLHNALTVTVPEHTPLVYAGFRGIPEPSVEERGGRTIYRWSVKDMPGIVPESFMPPMEAVAARVVYSTTSDWGQVAGQFAEAFYPHAVAESDLALAVDEWVGTGTTGEEKTREIFLHVVHDIRTVHLDLGRGGYEATPAPEVYHNRYGDCRDKAVVLVAALAKVGVTAFPVLYDDRRVDLVETVPTLGQFNDVMVAVETSSGYRFLDPKAEHCLYGFYPSGGGSRGLLVKPDGHDVVTIPEIPHDRNFSEKALRVTIGADGSVEGRIECSLGGHFDSRARRYLAEMTGKERQMEFAKAANRLSEGAALGQVSVSDLADLRTAASVSLSFTADGFGLVQGEMMILRLPDFPLHFANVSTYPGLESRTFDFCMESTLRESYRVELEIPDGYEAVYVPPAYSVETPLGRWEVTATVDPAHRLITIERHTVVKEPRIPVESYPAFKTAFDAVHSSKNSLVLLEKRS